MNCQASNEHIIARINRIENQRNWALSPMLAYENSYFLKEQIDQLKNDISNGIMFSVREEQTRNTYEDMKADPNALKWFENQLLGNWK